MSELLIILGIAALGFSVFHTISRPIVRGVLDNRAIITQLKPKSRK